MKNFLAPFSIMAFIFVLSLFPETYSQNGKNDKSPLSISIGGDLVSRYIFRGVEFGPNPPTPHVQPNFSLTYDMGKTGSLKLGGWASYGIYNDFSENDLYLKYTNSFSGAGTFSLTLMDLTFPYLGAAINNFEGDGNGAHFIGLTFDFSGPENLPVTFQVSSLVHNDFPGCKSLYLEVGYNFALEGINGKLFVGAAQGRSKWNTINSDKFEFDNIGVNFSKKLKISEDYSLPVGVTYILNWHLKQSFLVFKVSV